MFGISVAVSGDGDTVVVGANGDDVGTNNKQGSAYVFVRSGTSWSQEKKLTASDGAAYDGFGRAVAVSWDKAVVGAYLDDIGANSNQGSAYVFVGSGATWSQTKKLTGRTGTASDRFGYSVDINGNTVVVGAPYDDLGPYRFDSADRGSAYVFVRK